MAKKISQITVTEAAALSDTDLFEGEEAGGTSFKYAQSVAKSTMKTYFDGIYSPGYTLHVNAPIFNPADATTYYLGTIWTLAPITTANLQPVRIPIAGVITRVDLTWLIITTFGTAEQSTINLRHNNTTDYAISTTLALNANGVVQKTGLTIAVAAGDSFEIKWLTPTWVTNPVGLHLHASVWVSKA